MTRWGRLRRVARRAAVGGLAVLTLGAASLSDEQVVRNFDLIVFRSEYREGPTANLRKWVAPIRVYVDNRAGRASLHRALVERHVRLLAEITAHDIAIVERADEANLIAVFEREAKLGQVFEEFFPNADDGERLIRSSVCFGRYRINKRFEIVKAVVVIPPDRAASRGKLPACVVEEFTQVLGLPNDSAEVYPSIFNDRSVDDELTENDILLIRLLFDRRLRAGMPRPEALRRVREILPEVRR